MNHDSPQACAARAADPRWQEEQRQKNAAASARFRAYRESVGMPVRQMSPHER
jgi:hypothetical protein